jgi:hypothetical protein
MHNYAMKFASDLRQVSCFLRVLPVSSTNKTDRQNITEILLNMESKTIHSPHPDCNPRRNMLTKPNISKHMRWLKEVARTYLPFL